VPDGQLLPQDGKAGNHATRTIDDRLFVNPGWARFSSRPSGCRAMEQRSHTRDQHGPDGDA
jgi:hypothetical protein